MIKLAYVFLVTARGQVIPAKNDGEPVAFGVFKWFMAHRDEHGWSYHLLAFCNAVTDAFAWQSYQGVFVLGWRNGFYLEFSPGMTVYRLWLWPLRFEKGALS